jgi:hypothetical protein
MQLVAKVFGSSSWSRTALFWSGAVCCALGILLAVLGLRAPPHSADAASLFVAGLAFLCGGSGACVLGWSQRGQWVQLDELALSRPWALGKPSLKLAALSGIQESAWGGVVVSSTAGTQLRIAGDLPDFQELLDVLCDRIADNGYPMTTTAWQDGSGTITVSPRELNARWAGQENSSNVAWSEITELWLTRDEQQRSVAALTLDDGRELRFPHVGKARTLEIYRALRQILRHRRLPRPTAAGRVSRQRRAAENTRRLVLGIVVIAGLAGAVLGAQRSRHPSQQH